MDKRKEIYEELHAKYPDFVWKPQYMPLLKLVSPLIKRFPVEVVFESNLPNDGSIIFVCNHSNFYDTLVVNQALKSFEYFCLAGNEPRGSIQGLSFEARGVVWVDRNDKKSREISSDNIVEILANNQSIGWSPEGTWNLSDNRLLLNIAYGMAKDAIESSKYTNIYMVPIVIDYKYRGYETKIENAKVNVGNPIKVEPNLDYIKLTEDLTDIFWTTRWKQLEEAAKKDSNNTIQINGEGSRYVYRREELSKEEWQKFVERLKSQYKTNWELEESYAIKTKTQLEQEKVENDLENLKVKQLTKLKSTKQRLIF